MSLKPDKPIRKRNRPTVVCNNCRVKKTKCDRKLPCSNCEKLDLASSCSYNGAIPNKRPSTGPDEASANVLMPSPPYVAHKHHHQSPYLPGVPGPNPASGAPAAPINSQFQHSAYNYNLVIPPLGQQQPQQPQQPQQASPYGSNSDPTVQNELESLKNKLKELEASITVASMHKQSIPGAAVGTGVGPTSHSTSFSSANSPSIHSASSVGINSNSPRSTTHSTPNVHLAKQLLHSLYERTSRVEDSPTVAINPYLGDESVNFYLDFPIYRAGKLGYNYKPLPISAATRADASIELFLQFKQLLFKEASGQSAIPGSVKNKDGKCMGQQRQSQQMCFGKMPSQPLSSSVHSVLQKGDELHANMYKSGVTPEQMQKMFLHRNSVVETLKEHQLLQRYGLSTGVIFADRKFIELKTHKAKILAVLPPRSVFWKLIDRFFALLYNFIPILDEYSFRLDLTRIIGGPEEKLENGADTIVSLNLTKKKDYIFMGLALIVVRLGYISLFKNNQRANEDALLSNPIISTTDEKDLKLLLNNPISIDAVEVAELCMKEIDLTRRTSLVSFQFMLLLRTYRIYCPEEGYKASCHGPAGFGGILNSLAFSLGLNRDPDNYNADEGMHGHTSPVNDNSQKMDNLRRKLWHFLVAQEITESISHGTPLRLRSNTYDTKLPYPHEGNANVFDINIEMDVISSFNSFEKLRQPMIDLIDVLLDQRNRVPMRDFTKLVSKLELLVNTECGKFEEYLNQSFNSSKFLKIIRLKYLLICNQLLISIYYVLFLYYNKKDVKQRRSGIAVDSGYSNVAYFYYKKLLDYSLVKIIPYLPVLLDESRNYVHKSSAFFILPTIQEFNHSCSLINLITVAKLTSTVKILTNNPSHPESIRLDMSYKKYFDGLENLINVLVGLRLNNQKLFDILSQRYLNSWRTRKIHALCYQLLEKENFFQFNLDLTRNAAASFELHEMNEMAKLCQLVSVHNNNSGPVETLSKDADAKLTTFWQHIILLAPDDEDAPIDDLEDVQAAVDAHGDVKAGVDQGELNRNDVSTTDSIGTMSDNMPLDKEYDNSNMMAKSKGSPLYGLPFTPQFDFPPEATEYDLGIFNGQSFDSFFLN